MGLRKNQFKFGYEDYAVGVFGKLRRLEHEQLDPVEKREKLFEAREFVADQLIHFYGKTQTILEQMVE